MALLQKFYFTTTPFFAEPFFVVNGYTKMKVVENFGQLNNVMYENMGLLTWETSCEYPIKSTMLRISVLCKSVLNNFSINCLLSGDFIIAWKHEIMRLRYLKSTGRTKDH